MSGNKREQSAVKGFWNGGPAMKESAGQTSGYPGRRGPKRTGFRIDLEQPAPKQDEKAGNTPR
ncbi:MAG: hypothetical protein WC538_05965 [Thermoanaerobaculia bacterium]|jgi:hypothetical protein